MSYRDRFGFIIKPDSFNVSSLREFLLNCTYTNEELSEESSVIPVALSFLRNEKYSEIAEIGFGNGIVSEAILEKYPGKNITSFDQGLRTYSAYAKIYLERLYNNHTLIIGNPFINISKNDILYDVIIVNSFDDFNDIIQLSINLNDNGLIIVNDITPHNNYNTYEAYKNALNDGVLYHVNYIESNDFKSGIAVLTMNPNLGVKRPSHFFDKIERKMAQKKIIDEMVQMESLHELEKLYNELSEKNLLNQDIEEKYKELTELYM